ncbi:PadR-like family transcriptional regulator [Halobacterium phage phiH]|uniref:PadR-like family transcriptional regulator n=1 Tax=Halobacterium phage phiH TaxID=169684 RepID=A0A3G1ZKV9_BPPHH|nr:PadR-like family transcriptional regulator [Halobacterium phage phiH]AYM00305.1 PadR-like family transcriptional regulator [Halobacterium phage phiH]
MPNHDSQGNKGYEQSRKRFFGTSNADGPILKCVTCGSTVTADEAEDHDCRTADSAQLVTDGGGVNYHRDLTGFQRDILFVLRRIERGEAAEDQPYGLAIKRELEKLRDVDVVHHGRLYPNLDDLVDSGVIAKEMVDRRTNEYSTTNLGHDLVDQHAEWVLDSVAERLPAADGGVDQ